MNDSRDSVTRFLFETGDIRGEICHLKSAFSDAISHQALDNTTQVLLGDFCAAVCLLTGALKFEGTLTLQIRGDGPIPLIMAEANEKNDVRCIAKTREDLSDQDLAALDFRALFGDAALTLTLDPAKGKRYQGIVPLEGDSLAQCLEHYFAQSEQLPTRVWLYSDSQQTAGLMLQGLPQKEQGENFEDQWQTATTLANTATLEEMHTLDHQSMLTRLFHEFDVRHYPPKSVRFKCACSEARCANALTSLGEQEAFELLAEQGIIQMNCEFCGFTYQFDHAKLNNIFGIDPDRLH